MIYSFFYLSDAPRSWGLYFQDSASPQMEALVELHNIIMYYLVIILFSVGWILISVVKNYAYTNNPISNKYVNHGKFVPAKKCSNIKIHNYLNTYIRTYTTSNNSPKIDTYKTIPSNLANIKYTAFYSDIDTFKKAIKDENKGKSGIYMLTNKITGGFYVGQSIDLRKRFIRYFNISYLNSRKELVISRALIKYGYSNFSATILEYCDESLLDLREQYYFDILKPNYNIQKIAGGSSKGLILSKETKDKISKSLKGVYIGDKSYWYNKGMTEQTKELMSLKKKGEHNPFYGKLHREESKEIMRKKALGRKHSEETKITMATKRGNPLNIYEKCTSEEFKFIGSFVSARRAGKFLEISGSTIIKYMNSGAIFKDRYKFSSK